MDVDLGTSFRSDITNSVVDAPAPADTVSFKGRDSDSPVWPCLGTNRRDDCLIYGRKYVEEYALRRESSSKILWPERHGIQRPSGGDVGRLEKGRGCQCLGHGDIYSNVEDVCGEIGIVDFLPLPKKNRFG
jgi:hypothetical protein